MYTFQQQQKIFKDLLTNNPSNKQCADCNTIGPTCSFLNYLRGFIKLWGISLFKLFGRTSCTGADNHSRKINKTRPVAEGMDGVYADWEQGNQRVLGSRFRDGQVFFCQQRKPRMGAAQPELIKYASEKYVKKRYVKNPSEEDPLTKYKKGTYVKGPAKQETQAEEIKPVVKTQPQVPKIQKPVQVRSNVAVQNESKNLNLLEFEFPESPKLQVQSQAEDVNRSNGNHLHMPNLSPPSQMIRQSSENHVPAQHQDDDEFSEYTEHGTSFTGTTNDNALTYEELIAKKSNDSNGSTRYNIPTGLHHTQSASSIPHHHSPPFNVNMNGHTHHVGAHHNQVNAQYGNSLNFKQLYNQAPQHNPYQSVGYLPAQNNPYHPQLNSIYPGQNNQMIHGQQHSLVSIAQNFSLNHQNSIHYNQNLHNNNLQNPNFMSNQQNLNPSNMPLGGYHNQGYGSHSGQGGMNQGQKQEEFHWNDFSGWQGIGRHHQGHSQQQPVNQEQSGQQGQQGKSWIDDWK